jgi:hypothetical protein
MLATPLCRSQPKACQSSNRHFTFRWPRSPPTRVQGIGGLCR